MKALICFAESSLKEIWAQRFAMQLQPVPRKMQARGSEFMAANRLNLTSSTSQDHHRHFLMKSNKWKDASKKNGYRVEERPSLQF